MNKVKAKQVINQQVLEKLGTGDEFFQEVAAEVKPSRIEGRRQKSEQHEMKKARKRNFNEYN